MFDSISDLGHKLSETGYFIEPVMTQVVFLAANLQKPLLLEGPAGSGKDDLSTSMELARELVSERIEGLLFPSFVAGDDNLVVYLASCRRKALSLKNEEQVIEQVKQIAAKHK